MKEILSVNSQHANGKRKYSCEKKIRWAGPSQRRREQGRGSGLKNVLRKLLRIPYRRLKGGFFCVGSCECWLCLFVCHWESSEWNAQGERLLLKKPFTFVWLSSLENYFGFGTTNVKGKTDHPVSLRWNKEFWTFAKRRVFFWLFIRFICEQISPSFRRAELMLFAAFFN